MLNLKRKLESMMSDTNERLEMAVLQRPESDTLIELLKGRRNEIAQLLTVASGWCDSPPVGTEEGVDCMLASADIAQRIERLLLDPDNDGANVRRNVIILGPK